jgi:hypothetical protein
VSTKSLLKDDPSCPGLGELETVVDSVLGWSKARDYKGYNKHDALNSPLLRFALGWGRWARLFAIQGIMRAPFNLRPVVLVPETYNPKGLALFVQGLLDRYRTTGQAWHLKEARSLLSLLERLRSPGDWSGVCWGYLYPWQDLGFFAPSATPNAVVTSFVCEAFLDAYRVTGHGLYLETVGDALRFLLDDLKILKDSGDELCLSYMPLPMSMRVLDVSILIGAVAAQYGTLADSPASVEAAQRLVRYVVRRQTAYGAWYYTDPPTDSPIRHDNYHTGFILDALDRYMKAMGKRSWNDEYASGLAFYAARLFNDDGSPRWRSDVDYPHDIHGAAQGILTFSRHLDDCSGLSHKVATWALRKMYHPSGRFYYQERRWFIKRFTLLRWCNAWMFRALARLILELRQNETH